MFADLMKEVNTDKKKQIAGKNVNVNPTVQISNKQKQESDDIEDMLANLWSHTHYMSISNQITIHQLLNTKASNHNLFFLALWIWNTFLLAWM